jgi:hypothetical protein
MRGASCRDVMPMFRLAYFPGFPPPHSGGGLRLHEEASNGGAR